MRVDPQSIELPPASVSDHWRGSIHVVFPLIGQFHIAQCGHDVVISPGEGGLYDPSIGFKSAYESPVEFLVLVAPRAALLGHAANFKDRIAQRFSSETGSWRVTKDYLASLIEARTQLSPLTSDDFIAVAVQLTRLSILESLRQSSKATQGELMRERIQGYIQRNLHDPDLSIDSIARVHNCSKRYVHKIFSAAGATLGDYIRQARLERCMRDLTKAELAHLSVTEIAFSWGFQHQAHFSRLFRKHFNTSPSCCRRTAN
jgi:AraC-like DNA-binding protein